MRRKFLFSRVFDILKDQRMRMTEALTESLKVGMGESALATHVLTEESGKSLRSFAYLLASELTTVRKAEGKVWKLCKFQDLHCLEQLFGDIRNTLKSF